MITKIVNNLKLVISDVHFRLEDKSSDERHPFAVGAVLKEIRLDSVDDIWKSVNSGNDLTSAKLQGLIRKSLTIDQLGLYLDSNLNHPSLFVRAGHTYEQPQTIVEDMKWKAGRLASCSSRQYLIKPVNVAVKVAVDDSMIGGSGCAGYADVYKDTQLPSMLDIDIHITAFEINLSNDQYRDLLNCLAFFLKLLNHIQKSKISPKEYICKREPKFMVEIRIPGDNS